LYRGEHNKPETSERFYIIKTNKKYQVTLAVLNATCYMYIACEQCWWKRRCYHRKPKLVLHVFVCLLCNNIFTTHNMMWSLNVHIRPKHLPKPTVLFERQHSEFGSSYSVVMHNTYYTCRNDMFITCVFVVTGSE
jgi:hypothetical protein